MSGAVELQDGVYNKLIGDAGVMALIKGVYDNPQQVNPDDNSEFPFVTIGEASLIPWDTDTEVGTQASVVVHVWSRAYHHIECKTIQQAIYNTLHRDTIVITGYHLLGCDLTLQDAQRDPDGITVHGVQEFNIVFEEQ